MSESDSKKPLLGQEDAKHVEKYLNNLKERLQKLRSQQDDLIEDCVCLIKEIDDVSGALLVGSNDEDLTKKRPGNKIRKLINEFEQTKRLEVDIPLKTEVKPAAGKNMREVLLSFERINQSHVLQESLKLFRNAKESFSKVDILIGQLDQIYKNTKCRKPDEPVISSRNLNFQEKLFMFDNMSKANECVEIKQSPLSKKESATGSASGMAVEPKLMNISKPSMNSNCDTSEHQVLEQCSSEKIIHSDEEDSEHSDEQVQKIDVLNSHKSPSNSNIKDVKLEDSNASFKSFETLDNRDLVKRFSLSGYDGDCENSEFSVLAEKKKMKEF